MDIEYLFYLYVCMLIHHSILKLFFSYTSPKLCTENSSKNISKAPKTRGQWYRIMGKDVTSQSEMLKKLLNTFHSSGLHVSND